MPKVRSLTSQQAKSSLANRLGPRVDRLRQIATNFGLRPYRVYLVWAKYSGEERGEGYSDEQARIELLPTPKVMDLNSVAFSPFSGGVLPVGSVRIEKVSVTYTQDTLKGLQLPEGHENVVPQPWEFYYEIVEDGRGDPNPLRAKYRLAAAPFRRPGKVDWSIVLERISEDNNRDGLSPDARGRLHDGQSPLVACARELWNARGCIARVALRCSEDGCLYQD
jgi:hypothetical protein